MSMNRLLHKWPYLVALLGMLTLGGVASLALRAQTDTGALVEIVNDQPLHAEHRLPDGNIHRAVASGLARMEIPVDFYDFGAISAKAVVRRNFLVINRGSSPLVISQAYTTCGCATAEISASIIPPGKASRVTLVFDAGFHPVAGQTVRRGLVLETNDPQHSEAEIWVQASVGK
jgi:hypothetical protein